MRVIAGTLRGRRLVAPPAGDLSIRPTSDRAREALFSILDPRPRGPFVDLFAGTGAVGLEAHSRGHDPVWCVESAPAALKLLRRNLEGTPVAVLAVDARRLGGKDFREARIVFADPPYGQSAHWLARIAPSAAVWLNAGGLLIWESASAETLEAPEGFRLLDRRRYGAAAFHFFGICT